MSNHSYLMPRKDKFPLPDHFDSELRKFVDERFPMFTVERTETNFWYVRYKDPKDNKSTEHFPYCRELWFDRYRGKKCIEFRHATYGGQIMWWIEFEIENHFAALYEGFLYDDGLSLREKILPRPPQTYLEHCENMYAHSPKILRKLVIWEEIRSLPKELKKLAKEK